MRVQIRQLEGREHYVVPTVMITTGVHCGSQGPVYYPHEELQRSVPFWNAKPVVVYHPEMYSDGYAGNPEVFNRQKIGCIFNTSFDGHRLKADVWLEIERLDHVDHRVREAIQSRTMMEVSTGLVMDVQKQVGTLNGMEYGRIARNLMPDHLAILPDKIGACSIADGAGLLRNSLYVEEPLGVPSWGK